MIETVKIENYKSIEKLKLELGRVTVLVGENGSGKSNILEAIALASAAANNKLDNEFLVSRGIRVSDPQFMRSAFDKEKTIETIKINIFSDQEEFSYVLQNDNQPYSHWVNPNNQLVQQLISKFTQVEEASISIESDDELVSFLSDMLYNQIVSDLDQKIRNNGVKSTNLLKIDNEGLKDSCLKIAKDIASQAKKRLKLQQFLIYSPENTSLRTFDAEGAIQPLGIKGEGLFKLLKVLSHEQKEKLYEIQQHLKLIDWFEEFELPPSQFETEKILQIKDKYLDPDLGYFDQKSSNEGFLFLLFYFTLFISEQLTPSFFAIDNIDASLNPRLCRRLIQELVKLAKKYDKQVILTTHNPAVLDGLNLEDEEQKLFVISRNLLGHTKAQRINQPEPLEGQEPVKLSEAFLRGYIGGLPKNF
jgi:predicted ATPase